MLKVMMDLSESMTKAQSQSQEAPRSTTEQAVDIFNDEHKTSIPSIQDRLRFRTELSAKEVVAFMFLKSDTEERNEMIRQFLEGGSSWTF